MPSSAIQIELIETMPITGAVAPDSPGTPPPAAAPPPLPPPSQALPPSTRPEALPPPTTTLPPASAALDDVAGALVNVAKNLEELLKHLKDKKVTEVTDPNADPKLINQYKGTFGDTNRQFPGESDDDFEKRQNTQAKIGLGSSIATSMVGMSMGARRDPALDIGAAGETAARGLARLGPAGAIASEALKGLTAIVTGTMEALEARFQQIKQYSPELMQADARRNVARMQSDMGIAERNGPGLAKYIEQSGRLENNLSEMRAGMEQFAASVLTPVLKAINDFIEWWRGKHPDEYDAEDNPLNAPGFGAVGGANALFDMMNQQGRPPQKTLEEELQEFTKSFKQSKLRIPDKQQPQRGKKTGGAFRLP